MSRPIAPALLALLVFGSACAASIEDSAPESPPAVLAMSEPTPIATPEPTPSPTPPPPTPTPVPPRSEFWQSAEQAKSQIQAESRAYLDVPVAVAGTVIDVEGPVVGAKVELQGHVVSTDRSGSYRFERLRRRNAPLTVSADGHYGHGHAVLLATDPSIPSVTIAPISLIATATDRTRLLFGGDIALGRRYLDPGGVAARDELPEHDDGALIGVDTAYVDTRNVLADLAGIVEPYDLVSVNLESVVTDNPTTPWVGRNYVIYSLPESVRALADSGVDHVSLGNNHIWDYNNAGVIDTLAHVDVAGLGRSGAGLDADQSFEPYLTALDDRPIALHSFVSIEGVRNINRTAARADRGGGADLNNGPRVKAAIEATEALGALTVALPHTGYEYTEAPPDDNYTTAKMRSLVDLGADLVVAHHSHVPQGFEFHDDALIAHSLGNLAFDQLRLDTTFGIMAAATFDNEDLVSASVIPIFIDDFAPTWGAGERIDHLLRRLSMSSSDDVVLVASPSGATIARRNEAETQTRTIELIAGVDDAVTVVNGTAYLDLRDWREPHESLASVDGPDAATISFGRDLMLFGDMEDHDTDDDGDEITYWSTGESGFPCRAEARRGVGAVCSVRDADNQNPSTVSFGRRIRVLGDRINKPNKDLSLLFYASGENRGEVAIEAIYMASQGNKEFGTEVVAELPAGTADYAAHWVELSMPADDPRLAQALEADTPYPPQLGFDNARAARVRFRHYPPEAGVALSTIDDVALITWQEPQDSESGFAQTPNPYDFVRIQDTNPGDRFTLHLTSYELGTRHLTGGQG